MKLHCLHLSDVHLTGKDSSETFSQDAVTGSMLKKISELEKKLDFVIITGDIAYSGKPEEYETATSFCNELLKASGLTKERIYIVPGNHDIDRSRIKAQDIRALYNFDSQEDISETLKDEDYFPIIMRKFSGFSVFAEKAAGRKLFDETKFWFAETLCMGEHRISLIGLNSCIFAGYNGDEKQKLALGLYQVENALKGMDEKAFLSIGFFHHPFFCFHPADKVCRNLLTNRLDLILTGHLHKPDNAFIRNTAGQAVIISAGASYESREKRNSFNLIEIDTEKGTGRVLFYKYMSEHHLWKKDTDVNPNEDDGSFSFTIGVNKEKYGADRDKDIQKQIIAFQEREIRKLEEQLKNKYEESERKDMQINRLLELLESGLKGDQPKVVKVFISCAEDDTLTANKIYADLQKQGMVLWMLHKDINAGEKTEFAVRRAIKNSDYFLALLSTSSVNEKGAFQKELKQAFDILAEHPQDGIFVIPVRLDDCNPADEILDELHIIDLHRTSWKNGLEKIMQAVSFF